MNVAVKASLWFVACSILQKGISVITLPIFTRLMSTDQYGEYSIFQTWYNILILIITLNIQSDIFNKGLIDHSEEKDNYTANQAGLLITLAGIFLAVYLLLHDIINNLIGLKTYLMIIMFCEILANALIALWNARKRFDFDYKKIVSLTLITAVLDPVMGIILVALSENKAEARIFSNALVPTIVAFFMVLMYIKHGGFHKNYKWWKIAVMGSLPLLPHYLSLVLLNQSDKLMINYYIGTSEAGIYSVAHSAGLLMTIVNTSINGSFVPWAYGKIKDNRSGDIKAVANVMFLIVIIVNVCVIWFAPEAILILAAPEYADAVWCLVPIAASVFFYFVYTLFVDVEIYYGKNNYIAIASVCAAGMNLVLNYIFIPMFGFIAAGYTTLFSYFITMIMHYIFMSRALKQNGKKNDMFDMKIVGIMSVVLAGSTAVAMMLYNYIFVRFAIAIAVLVVLIIKREKFLSTIKMIRKK